MRYRSPDDNEAIEILSDIEFKIAGTEANCIARGRSKAWQEWRELTGVSARLRELALSDIGASVLFTEYTSTPAIGPLVLRVARRERVQFKCRAERSLIDGSLTGVRVTLAAYR